MSNHNHALGLLFIISGAIIAAMNLIDDKPGLIHHVPEIRQFIQPDTFFILTRPLPDASVSVIAFLTNPFSIWRRSSMRVRRPPVRIWHQMLPDIGRIQEIDDKAALRLQNAMDFLEDAGIVLIVCKIAERRK